jgi:hypothetical protein
LWSIKERTSSTPSAKRADHQSFFSPSCLNDFGEFAMSAVNVSLAIWQASHFVRYVLTRHIRSCSEESTFAGQDSESGVWTLVQFAKCRNRVGDHATAE